MGGARAEHGYYVQLPYAEPDRWTLDLRYWTTRRPGREAVLWPEVGLRWGVDSRWTSGLLVSWVGRSLRDQTIDTVNWQNSWLWTQGEGPVDVALFAQWSHSPGRSGLLEAGPLLQTELGHTQLNFNLLLSHDQTARDGTQLKLQWQALHRVDAGLRLGAQGFADLGRWDHWSERLSARAGPVLRLGRTGRIEWQAAYLWGRIDGRRGDMFSSQLQVPF
jgi:hypothetical protein